MIKYNVMLYSLIDVESSDLEALIDEFECKEIKIEEKGKYIYYNLIISENYILPFLSELPYDYIVKYIFDDILYQMNLINNKRNNIDIYRHIKYDKKPNYKLIMNDIDKDILNICKYLEKYN